LYKISEKQTLCADSVTSTFAKNFVTIFYMKKYFKSIKQCADNSGITMETGNINDVCNQFVKDFKKLVTE
jgi:hypothetical protein